MRGTSLALGYYNDPEKTALEGIFRLEQHFKRMGLAVRLSEVNITEDAFEAMADKGTSGDTAALGNFVKLDKKFVPFRNTPVTIAVTSDGNVLKEIRTSFLGPAK